ncbi:MAG: HAMP domain-containing sensor histidine kinase [Nonlabens sp.]
MEFAENKNFLRWTIITGALVLISLILWNTYSFYQQLKDLETRNIEEFALAQYEIQTQDLNDNVSKTVEKILQNNTTIPVIVVNKDGQTSDLNIPEEAVEDSLAIARLIRQYAQENEPIVSYFEDGPTPFTTTYYGNSVVVTQLKYYPMALVLIMLLFGAVIWFFYRSNKAGEQNKLWAGMAKESAHQIGTPLSSLVGWTTILRESDVDSSYVDEMEKDIDRLRMITDRFSKIGSIPELKKLDVVQQTQNATDYIRSRSSSLIDFKIDLPDQPLYVKLNEQLFSWVIENLIKNAIDAMKGKGTINIYLRADAHKVIIAITDTGKGIARKKWNLIFNPGYTTKKRGWGLGLSLARRIIQDYHRGKIYVADSKQDHGTTFEILLPRGT